MFYTTLILIFCFLNAIPTYAGFVPDILTGEYGETILGKGNIVTIDLSPDKKTLATGTYMGIFLWDMNGEMERPYHFIPIRDFLNTKIEKLERFFEQPYCMQFLDNDNIIAGVRYLTIYTLDGTKKSVFLLDYSPDKRYLDFPPLISRDGRCVFSWNDDYVTYKKWNIQSGLSTYQGHYHTEDNSYTIDGESWWVTSDGKYIVQYTQDSTNGISTFYIDDTENLVNQEILNVNKFAGYAKMLKTSEDSKELYIITSNKSSNGDQFHYYRYSIPEKKIVFEKDLSAFLSQSDDFHERDGDIFIFNNIVFNASDAAIVSRLDYSIIDQFGCVDNLVFGKTDDGFLLWNALDGKKILYNPYFVDMTLDDFRWPNYPYRPCNFGFQYSNQKKQINFGKYFYTLGSDSVKKMELDGDFTLQYSKDGSKLYRAGFSDSTKSYQVYTCNSETGKTENTFSITEAPDLLLQNDHLLLACEPILYATETRDIFFYDMNNGSLAKKLNLPLKSLRNILLSPLGDEILFYGDKTIFVPLPELSPIKELSTLYPDYYPDMAYGETSNEILYGVPYGIELYDRSTGERKTLAPDQWYYPYYTINIIPNMPYILSSCFYEHQQVLIKKYEFNTVEIPLSNRYALVIDDNKIVCGSLDGTTRIWDIKKLIDINSGVYDFMMHDYNP